MTPAEIEASTGLGLEETTIAALRSFAELVEKWTPRINLVSRNSLPLLWQRHILDSIQLYCHAPSNARLWADFGSGGGFPGIVLAILSRQMAPDARHVLVESDLRKATFLREALRATGVSAQVISARIESVSPLGADVVTARALAALPELFGLLAPHMAPGAVAILPKGANAPNEIKDASSRWHFDLETFTSLTESDARILRVTQLRPRTQGLEST